VWSARARTTEEAARRELAEEIGVPAADLVALFEVRYRNEATQLIGRAFLTHHDGPVVLQATEVEWGDFVPLAEAERIARDELCCPDGVQVLRRFLAEATATTS
jgi:8-oxo-dGTP pyrophosphatase MutT (NUDIX family)